MLWIVPASPRRHGEQPTPSWSASTSRRATSTSIMYDTFPSIGGDGEQACTSMSSKCPFTFEDGSTRIIVTYKGKRVVGSVSPYAMALASPVWKKFVFSPFRQTSINRSGSKPALEPMKELDFCEDPAEALLILLRITHYQFASIPSTLPLTILSKVAILCDQYDCVHLVKPWLSGWLAMEDVEWRRAYILRGREKWLFIAWVFGREKVLKELAWELVQEMQMMWNGQSFQCLALTDVYGPMPDGLIERILHVRRATIEKLLAIPRQCIERFTKNSNVLCLHGQKSCDVMTYRSLLREFQRIQIRPNMNADDVYIPLKDLAQRLSHLQIHALPMFSGPLRAGNLAVLDDNFHKRCFENNIKEQVAYVMAGIGNPILESHVRHLAIQRAKLNGGN